MRLDIGATVRSWGKPDRGICNGNDVNDPKRTTFAIPGALATVDLQRKSGNGNPATIPFCAGGYFPIRKI